MRDPALREKLGQGFILKDKLCPYTELSCKKQFFSTPFRANPTERTLNFFMPGSLLRETPATIVAGALT